MFTIFFALTFTWLHFDVYPFTTLMPFSSRYSALIAALAGLCAGAYAISRKND